MVLIWLIVVFGKNPVLVSSADSFSITVCGSEYSGSILHSVEFLSRGAPFPSFYSGGAIKVFKRDTCRTQSLKWSIPVDSLGYEIWQFELEKKNGNSKKYLLWREPGKIILSDPLLEINPP